MRDILRAWVLISSRGKPEYMLEKLYAKVLHECNEFDLKPLI